LSLHVRPRHCCRANDRGFSLVELLCSVALSLLLLAGVVAMVSGSYTSYQNAERTSELEERGWRALDLLSRDIRNAGFGGCTRSPQFLRSLLNDGDAVPWNFLDGAIRGYQAHEKGWAPEAPRALIPDAIGGSDVLVLRVPKRGADPLRVRTDMASPEDSIKVHAAEGGLLPRDIALIYDCEARVYFQATEISNGIIQHAASGSLMPGNVDDSLGYSFRAGAEIIPVQTVIYFIRQDSPESDAKSLWRTVGSSAPEKLVEGVETMQLQFGIDVTGDGVIDSYVTAERVPDWERVHSVSIAMLVVSDDVGEPETKSFVLLDETVQPSDTRMRRVFSATASLRNRET
jgi:type IV pilus assembly protein PilW